MGISPGCNIGGGNRIGNLCFIGIGSTVVHNLVLEDETLLGAGSLLLQDTEKYSKYVGNPAKKTGEHREEGIHIPF